MQKQRIYGVYDKQAEAFTPIFTEATDGLAIRTIQNAMSNPESNLNRYNRDYTLYSLGEFDMSTGELTPTKRAVMELEQLITKE